LQDVLSAFQAPTAWVGSRLEDGAVPRPSGGARAGGGEPSTDLFAGFEELPPQSRRLVIRFEVDDDLAAQVEAICDLRERPQHFAPAAARARTRIQLAEAVHRRERARSKLRRLQPEEALSEWAGLVAGRWSLLDEVKSDGRRFIVAQRNPVPALPLATLTPEQAQVVGFALLGHSNKLIAYELGLTESGVAMRLSRAAHKFGARSRVAMIRTVRQLLEQEP
jgi:DNA-binding NarL/FixJ family response regulator